MFLVVLGVLHTEGAREASRVMPRRDTPLEGPYGLSVRTWQPDCTENTLLFVHAHVIALLLTKNKCFQPAVVHNAAYDQDLTSSGH